MRESNFGATMLQEQTCTRISSLIIEKFVSDQADILLSDGFARMLREKDTYSLTVLYSNFIQTKGGENSNPIESLKTHFQSFLREELRRLR